MWTIPDSATRAAWFSAATQQEQLELLAAALGSAPRKVVLGASGELSRVTMAAPTINTGTTPRRLELGQVIPSTLVNTALGTMTSTEIRSAAGTVILRADAGVLGGAAETVEFFGAIKQRCAPSVGGTGIVVQANAALPVGGGPAPNEPDSIITNAMWGNSATYFVANSYGSATYFGIASKSEAFRVVRWPHATRVPTSFTLRTTEGGTDHGAPTVLRRADGRLLCIYSGHNTPELYQRISTNADDISAFGPETAIVTGGILTYTLAIQLDGVIALFYRDAGQIMMRWTTNGGDSWSSAVQVLTMPGGETPYPYPVKTANNRIDIFVSPIGGGVFYGIYHVYLTWNGSSWTWRRTDGTALSLPIVPTSQATAVYLDPSAQYVIPETSMLTPSGGLWLIARRKFSASATADYMLVRQSGSTWLAPTLITSAGHPVPWKFDYLGGATFDLYNHRRVFASVGDSASGPWELRSFTTSDDGATFSLERNITSGSAAGVHNMKPVALFGDPDYKVAFLKASQYDSFTAWTADLWGAA